MPNPLLDIRIGTMVRANLDDPAAYVRQILPLGFESIQPFFWQTLGGKDIPRLAGELREAIGNADVTISSIGVFGNPLEDGDNDREVLAAWETIIDNAHLFGADTRQRLHRPHPRQAADRQPAALPRSLGQACQARGGQGRAASPSRTARWTATGRPATGTSPTIPMPGS